jgi:hypothetical protein
MNTKLLLFPLALLVTTVAACGKGNGEIPKNIQGSYKVDRFLLGSQTVVVEAKQLKSPDCKVNCGVTVLPLTDIKCEPVINPTKCTYKSEHCTGTIELETDGTVSISADVVPGATGDMVATRNMTCAGISGNSLPRQ